MNSYKNNKFSFLFQSIIAILPTLDNLSTQSCAQAVDYILFLPPSPPRNRYTVFLLDRL